MATAMCPEMNALVELLRAAIGTGAGDFPNIGKLDGALFQRLATWHKVMPLVARAQAEMRSPAEREPWSRVLVQAAAEAERKLAWQRELCEALETRRISVFPLRGLLLARALYGEMHLRAMADIDLLVKPSDAVRAMDTLLEMGLRPPLPLRGIQRSACVHFRSECAFLDPQHGRAADLHWRAIPTCFELIGDDALWSGAVRTELGGYFFLNAQPAHQLLLLCAHGTKHGWDRLAYVVDFAAALQRFSERAVAEAGDAARRSGRRRLWQFALLLTREILGVSPPPEWTLGVEEAALKQTVQMVREALLDSTAVGARGGRERKWLGVMLRRRDRWRYWREMVLAPSLIELSAVMLPRPLWVGYRGMRLTRLAARAITRRGSAD